jgi:hypothetical protein
MGAMTDMAMTKCKECGAQISTKAETCPQCGAKPKKTSGCAIVVLGFILLIVFADIAGQCSGPDTRSSSASSTSVASKPSTPPAAPTVDKSPEKQKEREKLINELQQRGVLGNIECRSAGATAVVGRNFYQLDFETKQSFIGVVYAYCFDGTKDFVGIQLRDIRTNKKIGEFSKEFGLKLN